MEQLEINAYRVQLGHDLQKLVERYRAIFDWDVPEVDEALSDRLIFRGLRDALEDLERDAMSRAAR
jgi:hypothetical protein